MSSILRALKRLEERPTDAGGPPWQEKFAAEHTQHTVPSRSLSQAKPVILVGALALLAVGWWMARGPNPEEAPAPVEATSQRSIAAAPEPPTPPSAAQPPTAAAPQAGRADRRPAVTPNAVMEQMRLAQQRQREASTAERATLPPVTAPGPTTTPAVPSPPSERATTTGPQGESVPPQNIAVAPQVRTVEDDALQEDAVTPPVRPVRPDVRARPPAPAAVQTPANAPPAVPVQRPVVTAPTRPDRAPAEPTLTRLRDDTIKLQAVAWANDPERRMAVINEQVVREGQTIQAYTITTIRERSVVVRKDGQEWELRYGH